MRPILALELSQDGIKLHELSYDSAWRELGFASLDDEDLPQKMAELRAMARNSQGRFFKNELWVPDEQVFETTLQLSTHEDNDRLGEAYSILNDDEEFARGDYVVQVGEPDANGNTAVAIIDRNVLEEARRFAHGYKFGSDGITSAQKLEGFYQQPYFEPSQSVKLPINFRAVGFYLTIALLGIGVVAGAVSGGVWLYNNIDFSREPDTPVETTEITDETPNETSILDVETFNPEGPTIIPAIEDTEPAPVEPAPANLPAETPEPVENGATTLSFDPVTTNVESGLPTEDSTAMVNDSLPEVIDSSGPSELEEIGTSESYQSSTNANLLETDLTQTDILPQESSTTVLAAQLQKLNDSLGLSQIRDNQLAEEQFAVAMELQMLPPVLINELPEIIPTLRGGGEASAAPVQEVTAIAEDNLEPGVSNVEGANVNLSEMGRELTLDELQSIPPVVFNRLPDDVPLLREGGELPPAPAADESSTEPQADPDTETTVAESDTEEVATDGPIVEITEADTVDPVIDIASLPAGTVDPALQAAAAVASETFEVDNLVALQDAAPVVITGRPAAQPLLRDGDDIPEGDPAEVVEQPPEEQTDAERLLPIARPETVETIAVVNDPALSEQVVTNSLAPVSRPSDLAEKAEVMIAAIAEEERTAPRPTVDPNAVVVPTSANVAAEATIEDGINLQATSLIGVYGSDGARRALVRQRGGRYKMLEIGDKIDGWTVIAISESELTLHKGSKSKVLKLPS